MKIHRNSKRIHSIEFSEDSELCVTEEYAFMHSTLKKIKIPSSVIKLSEGWCGRLSKLEIEMKVNNQHYSKFEDKFILGKKDGKSDKYNVLVYSFIIKVTIKIPSFIKRIAHFACSGSESLHIIEFEGDSELESIVKFAFANSSLENIRIPKKIALIDKSAFSECNIKHIEFEELVKSCFRFTSCFNLDSKRCQTNLLFGFLLQWTLEKCSNQ